MCTYIKKFFRMSLYSTPQYSRPLLKDKSGSVHDEYNYRAITLLPVISKVFEMVLLAVCEPVLESDSLQFGFKHNAGCNVVVFSVKSVIKGQTPLGGFV